MTENKQLIIWFCKILLAVICSIAYRLGGQYEKAIRRYVMPIVLFLGLFGIGMWKGAFNPLILISLPLFIGSLCLGYGATDIWSKIKRRFIYGLSLGISFMPFAFVTGNWILFGYHLGLIVTACVVFGVFNPFPEKAAGEEATIGLLSVLIPTLMI